MFTQRKDNVFATSPPRRSMVGSDWEKGVGAAASPIKKRDSLFDRPATWLIASAYLPERLRTASAADNAASPVPKSTIVTGSGIGTGRAGLSVGLGPGTGVKVGVGVGETVPVGVAAKVGVGVAGGLQYAAGSSCEAEGPVTRALFT